MSVAVPLNSAEQAAEDARAKVQECRDQRKSFVLEAGAGSGKTYSLIETLRYLIKKEGAELLKHHRRIACVTYTNVAKDEIESRTDKHPAIRCDTIHAFCWSLIKDFQKNLRVMLPGIGKWTERIAEQGELGTRPVVYDLGYPSIEEKQILLHHDDVLALGSALFANQKFRQIVIQKFPILLIDEYQDTDKSYAESLVKHFLEADSKLLIGLFGDHWQKIYGEGCGKLVHAGLTTISKHSNFRSVSSVVNVLNRMRPELAQEVKDPTAPGSAVVFHTNGWQGARRTGQHWGGDLPSDVAHEYLEATKNRLKQDGWDFSPEKTKILMLTHNVLAEEQGYRNLAGVFSRNESYIKKEDHHIAFLVDVLEPICEAYASKQFGEMFSILGNGIPAVRTAADKAAWATDIDKVIALRETATIGDVIDFLRKTKRPQLPEAVERREQNLGRAIEDLTEREASSTERLRNLRLISYSELIALARFLNGHTCFSTKHSVKGAEFENVLVVIGRGWNLYNFDQMLAYSNGPVPENRKDAFERSRNLFYVACSRPKRRLALLFTQLLSDNAISTLKAWFGKNSVHASQIT